MRTDDDDEELEFRSCSLTLGNTVLRPVRMGETVGNPLAPTVVELRTDVAMDVRSWALRAWRSADRPSNPVESLCEWISQM